MKCLSIVVDIGFEDLVLGLLRSIKVETYIKLPTVYGVIESLEPLLGTHIFPGQMVMYMVYVPDDEFEMVKAELVKLKERLKGKSFLACSHDIELI